MAALTQRISGHQKGRRLSVRGRTFIAMVPARELKHLSSVFETADASPDEATMERYEPRDWPLPSTGDMRDELENADCGMRMPACGCESKPRHFLSAIEFVTVQLLIAEALTKQRCRDLLGPLVFAKASG